MEFRILGPLEVRDQGRPLSLTAAKQRTLLGILIVHPNQIVSTDLLIEEIWGWAPTEDGCQRAAGLRHGVARRARARAPTASREPAAARLARAATPHSRE